MKKTKFAVLITAFMAVLGLSSCLGEPDPYNYGEGIFRADGFPGYYKFSTAYGMTLIPTNQSIITDDLGSFAYIYYKYDTRTVSQNSENLNIELQQTPVPIKTIIPYENEGNAPFVSYQGSKEVLLSRYLYDKNSLFISLTYNVRYNTKDQTKNDLDYHEFNIWKVEEESSSEELVLRLSHTLNSVEIENEATLVYNDIRRINLLQYINSEETPKKIIIKYQVEKDSSSSEEDNELVDVEEPFTLDYDQFLSWFPKVEE